jgi:transcription elongation GreA/GreB family factor
LHIIYEYALVHLMLHGPIVSPEEIQDGSFYALPHEVQVLKNQFVTISEQRAMLAGHIQDAMEQSSETWHDNAPADALFGEMKLLDRKEATMRRAEIHLVVVEYPDPEFRLVTMGSRVGCVIAGSEFLMDIVGNLPITLKPEDDIEAGSVIAPIPKALLGAKVGSSVVAQIGKRNVEVSVSSLDQVSQRMHFEPQA